MGKILFLNIGKPEEYLWKGRVKHSAIAKRGVKEAFLAKEGFSGDEVAEKHFHGGPDRAVCFYPNEHYAFWEKEFGVQLESPSFGENISTLNMQESEVYIGDIYQLGDAVIQVSQGRIPCSKISAYNGVDLLLKKVVETGYTGYFFRVLQEGKVSSDSNIILLERIQETFSILKANQFFFQKKKDDQAIGQLLEVDELAVQWKLSLKKQLIQKS